MRVVVLLLCSDCNARLCRTLWVSHRAVHITIPLPRQGGKKAEARSGPWNRDARSMACAIGL